MQTRLTLLAFFRKTGDCFRRDFKKFSTEIPLFVESLTMRITTRQFAGRKNFNKLHEFSFQTDSKVALSSVIRAISSNKQNLFSSMNCFVSFSPRPTAISLTTLIETIMICDKTFSLESFEIFKSTTETRVYTREPNKLNVQ